MLACGEREVTVMALPAMRDWAVSPCFHAWLAFLHRHFPPQSPPSHLLGLSLHSQQQPLPWDCTIIPKLQVPATAPSRGPVSLSRVCMAVARTVILIPFRLPQINCFTLGLNVSPLTQTIALMWGLDARFSSPTCWGQVHSYYHSCFSP